MKKKEESKSQRKSPPKKKRGRKPVSERRGKSASRALSPPHVPDQTPTDSPLCPCFESEVQAGFPSPADGGAEPLNIVSYLVPHPENVCYLEAEDDAMIGAGIFSGDLTIVDRSILPRDGDVVAALVEDDLLIRRLVSENGSVALKPENRRYRPIPIDPSKEVQILGVIRHSIHSFHGGSFFS